MAKTKPIWQYGPVPPGFWTRSANRRAYFEWLEHKLRIRRPEDWYEITRVTISRFAGGMTFLSLYRSSVLEIVREFVAWYDWKEWLFRKTPGGFWDEPGNRRRYLDWLGEKLDCAEPEDWYQLTAKLLGKYRGATLAAKFHCSICALLRDYMPEYPWKEWLFPRVPRGFWNDRQNRRRYLDWLAEELGFKTIEDWYRLTTETLGQYRGDSITTMYRGSPYAVVKAHFPEYPWVEWRFRQVSAAFWDDPRNRRRYLDWLGEKLGFKSPEDWYGIDTKLIKKNYGSSLLTKYGGSPSAIVMSYMPEYSWQEWRFRKPPDFFWADPRNRRRYLDWLGEELGFNEPEDWYALSNEILLQNHGVGMVRYFNGSPSALLAASMPDYDWLEWRFTHVPNRFWSERRNRVRYLDWLGEQLGFKRLEDWYQVTKKDIANHHGLGLLLRFGSSKIALLKDYRPEYDWKEWLFRRSPRKFWTDRANRRRYLAWLGEKLGYEQPEDWLRLRRKDLINNGGVALLGIFPDWREVILKECLCAHHPVTPAAARPRKPPHRPRRSRREPSPPSPRRSPARSQDPDRYARRRPGRRRGGR